jgi:nicotinamide-nucleotide adenylyltransferase
MEALVTPLLQRLRRGASAVELVHVPHNLWPLRSSISHHGPLRISVLDSSFNPPTLAHLALANSPLPRTAYAHTVPGDSLCDYDAKLLLLSVRNADKSLKPTDATYLQRLEMIVLLAKDIIRYDQDGKSAGDANVAVAVIDEPTFVGKSGQLLSFFRQRLAELNGSPQPLSSDRSSSYAGLPIAFPPAPHLTFLQGLDTLERLFFSRYYPSEEAMRLSLCQFFSPDGDASRVVCARRIRRCAGLPEGSESRETQASMQEQSERERKFLASAQGYLDNGSITLIDIRKDEQTFSSTEVREKLCRGDDSWRKMTTNSIADYIVEQKLYIGRASDNE